ncbi:hypothetical protein Ahy_A05g021750 [Arachis hypogaea]|uniref:Tyrosine-specific transport protein n=1 Tax=Arachis hypogaea TaxID=3818 RepID=A0A445CYC4_ARAHY|nr:hypothetical protein Ahy_A05g021750 [Arachis hypogaea]
MVGTIFQDIWRSQNKQLINVNHASLGPLMDSQCITHFRSSSYLHLKIQRHAEANSSWAATNPPRKIISFKISNSYGTCLCYFLKPQQQKPSVSCSKKGSYARKAEKCCTQLSNFAEKTKKKGSVAGAVALIIGTSIGSGILVLPQKASPAGFIPSSISVILCWVFLLIEALLLVEINVALMRNKEKEEEDNELEAISIRTMAQETLGVWGGSLATIAYVFLAYSSMVAYCSKSGEILFKLMNIPAPVSGCLFASLFAMLVCFGGTRATDQVNQYLTASMIGLLLAIEVVAVLFGGWSGVGGNNDWTKVPPTIPVIIFSLVYHDIAPVLCAYLEGDLTRIRASVILALGTSLIGTLLAFSEFFKEQLKSLSWHSTSAQKGNWWGRNKVNLTAVTMVVAPSLFVSTTFPDAFSAATDIAGGYCMSVLYGVLPPAMAWAMDKGESKHSGERELSNARPALIVVGLFACGIVVEQIIHDLLALHL